MSIFRNPQRHYCGSLREEHIGQRVTVCGWCARMRDLGGLIFIDLRDREGIVQCVFDEADNKELFDLAFTVRSEFTLKIEGVVRQRSSINDKIPTGRIEILADSLEIYEKADTPPFEISDDAVVNDALRLKYRYLDLRRPSLQRAIALRHRIAHVARQYFDEQGFLEIETPMLTKSTPEGARDYLVPSRVHPGEFYALPQSPQQYKQLLMLSGFDRYMQIVRCFRDEDLRADRQPEFTQIDLEMSFVDQEDVMAVNEGFLQRVFHEVLGVDIQLPIQRMPYQEAMERFGSDKPDLRFGYEIFDLSETVKDCGFGVFDNALAQGGTVRGIMHRRRRQIQPQGDRQPDRVRQDLPGQGPGLGQDQRQRRDELQLRQIPAARHHGGPAAKSRGRQGQLGADRGGRRPGDRPQCPGHAAVRSGPADGRHPRRGV